MWLLSVIPFFLQALAMVFDEGYFHIRRGLPKWERIGHPIDTASVLACMGFVLFVPFSKNALILYSILAIVSSILVTKDEFVHKEHCPASENWLHAVLFTLHPITLIFAGFMWPVSQGVAVTPWISNLLDNPEGIHTFLYAQFATMTLFLIYQIVYWNFIWKEPTSKESSINNGFYDDLQEGWYKESHHPIALLRAENKIRNPWISEEIRKRFSNKASILDVGCGAGLLTNSLALDGHSVTGIDLSEQSLKTAERYDTTKSVKYIPANAYSLPFPDQSFDVVCAMDILEHVETPNQLIREAARVLKKDGIFFFHTFNRNWLSYVLIIKGVDWFVKNAPKNMHVYPLFIKPKELESLCIDNNLNVNHWVGLQPKVNRAFFQMLVKKTVPDAFTFRFSKNLSTGYCGFATKTR